MQVINIIESRNGIIDNVESFILLHNLEKIAVEEPELLLECRNLNQEVVERAEKRYVELIQKKGFIFDEENDDDEYQQAESWICENREGFDVTLVWSNKVE